MYRPVAEVEPVEETGSDSSALVVIRYPAIIHADAEKPYFHAFSISAIGGEVPPANRTKKVTTRIAQSVIAKSNYYVMSLYRELQKALPQDTVLLSPHIIMWDAERGIYSRPILATEQIPSVVTVDFNVYSYPDTEAMIDSPPITFGDLVTPLFVVHGDRWLQPSTNGLLLSSDALMGTAWALSEEEVKNALQSRLNNEPVRYQRPLDFISFLNRRAPPAPGVPRREVGGSPGGSVAVESYPLEKILLEGALLENLSADFEVDPFAESFIRGAAARVKQTLSEADHDKATFFARQNALARFDPELALANLGTMEAELVGKASSFILDEEHRWSRWAAPKKADGTFDHDNALVGEDLIDYVNHELFPYLQGFKHRASGPDTIEYKIGAIFSEIKNKFQSGYSLRDALDGPLEMLTDEQVNYLDSWQHGT